MSPSHAEKQGARFRYYVSQVALRPGKGRSPSLRRIPAHDLEDLVMRALRDHLTDQRLLVGHLQLDTADLDIRERLATNVPTIIGESSATTLIERLVTQVILSRHAVRSELARSALLSLLQIAPSDGQEDQTDQVIAITVPTVLKRYGAQKKILVPGQRANQPVQNEAMIKAVLRAHAWQRG